jgi:hypothetical protein
MPERQPRSKLPLLRRSHIGQVEAALRLLGKRIEVRVMDTADATAI